MTARREIMSALSEIDVDNSPTPERQEKSNFSVKSGAWRTRTIADRLYASEKINTSTFNDCQRWLMAFVLMHDGPGAIQSSPSNSTMKHDKISWFLEQAKRKDGIAAVREFIGRENHNILVLTLYDCYSANSIAGFVKSKKYANSTLCKYIDKACVEAYQKLSEFYKVTLRNGG